MSWQRVITAASVHDKPVSKTLEEDIKDISGIKKVVADGAYKGEPPFTLNGRIEWQIVERIQGSPFKVLPERWIVERTLSWLSNFRRLSRDYEKLVVISKAMLITASIIITLNKLCT